MKITIISLLLSSTFLLPARGIAQQSSDDPVAGQAQSLGDIVRKNQADKAAGKVDPVQVLKALEESVTDFCSKNPTAKPCTARTVHQNALDLLPSVLEQLKANAQAKATAQGRSADGPAAENQAGKPSIVAQQPSLGDLSRQIMARRPKEQDIAVYEGHLTIRTIPTFADTQSRLITQIQIAAGNTSRRDYRYVFTAKCGEWSKKLSANIKGSSDGMFPHLKSILIDVPSPCDWSTAVFNDFREAEGLDGPEPQPSKVPGIDNAELARRATMPKVVETSSTSDSASAAEARMNKACSYGLSMTAREITNTMADCNKAENDWENAIRAQAEAQNRAKAEAMRGSVAGSDYLISLTGTPGLPVTGSCSFAGKSESYDDVLPAQHVIPAGRGVICSFVKRYVQGTLKMQIIQNGAVRNEAETEASYGVVSLTVDW